MLYLSSIYDVYGRENMVGYNRNALPTAILR